MATIVERNGKFQAKIRKHGVCLSETFERKANAEAWIRREESKIERGLWCDLGEADKLTGVAALDRYMKTKTAKKKSKARETNRIKALQEQKFLKKPLSKITSADLASFKEAEEARNMSGNTIRLDFALISHLFNVAASEWGMPGLQNPVSKAIKPKAGPGRDRRLRPGEEEKLIEALLVEMPKSQDVKALVVVAIETGMRESELLGLRREDIRGRVAHLADTKAGLPRDVPLSLKAKAALDALPARLDGKIFSFGQDRLVRAMAAATKAAGLADLKFHDLRHEAASRMAKLYQAHELAKIFGWKTIQMAMRYYHADVDDFIARMDAGTARQA